MVFRHDEAPRLFCAAFLSRRLRILRCVIRSDKRAAVVLVFCLTPATLCFAYLPASLLFGFFPYRPLHISLRTILRTAEQIWSPRVDSNETFLIGCRGVNDLRLLTVLIKCEKWRFDRSPNDCSSPFLNTLSGEEHRPRQAVRISQRLRESTFKWTRPPPGGSNTPNPGLRLPPLLASVPSLCLRTFWILTSHYS